MKFIWMKGQPMESREGGFYTFTLTNERFLKYMNYKCMLYPYQDKTYRWVYVHQPFWWDNVLMKNNYFKLTTVGQVFHLLFNSTKANLL